MAFDPNAGPRLGRLCEPGDTHRDAVHVAVVPATTAEALRRGDWVRIIRRVIKADVGVPLDPDEEARFREEHVGTFLVEEAPEPAADGVVDPLLRTEMSTLFPTECFLVVLKPGSITGLRHVYDHSAFQRIAAEERAALQTRWTKGLDTAATELENE
jgi:hypothetical protein